MKKKVLILCLCLALVLSGCSAAAVSVGREDPPAADPSPAEMAFSQSAAAQAGGFIDVPETAWYAQAVAYVKEQGLMEGVGGGSFAPDRTLTRAMMIQVLYNSAGKPAVSGESGFEDVKPGAWYEKAVTWARQQDITSGVSATRFGVDSPLTREQMAVFFWNAAGMPEGSTASTFADAASVSRWAKEAVAWVQVNQVMSGTGENRFSPRSTATRGQVAQVLMNAVESGVLSVEGQGISPEPDPTEESDPSAPAGPAATTEPGADRITTDAGQVIALGDLEHYSASAASTVYYTSGITPEGLQKVYDALNWIPTGTLAVKVSTGEPPASNYLRPELIGDLVRSLEGTIVECNTAYGGSRASAAMHRQVAADHGFTGISRGGALDIMDENGSVTLPVKNAKYLTDGNYVGANFQNYDSFLVLSHFTGHSMAGYGGAIKNISIGIASREGKARIHTANRSSTNPWIWDTATFQESMGEAAQSVIAALGDGKNIVYVNVMNRLSVDCDCNGNPSEPDMHDIGILASTDPVALDQACLDLVYQARDNASLVRRVESLNGVHTLEYAEQIGIGSRTYRLADVDQTGGENVKASDFNQFQNVTLTGVDLAALDSEQMEVLYAQAKYCQAMCDADMDTLRSLVAEDKTFTHMSGRVQTREEYFADIAKGSLNYFSIGMEDPAVTVSGNHATVQYTAVLNANAYGARGTYRMSGTHTWEKRGGAWISVNE